MEKGRTGKSLEKKGRNLMDVTLQLPSPRKIAGLAILADLSSLG